MMFSRMYAHSSAKKRTTKGQKGRRFGWKREGHDTRSTTKRQSKETSNKRTGVQQNVVDAIVVQDPKHYGDAIKIDHRKQWLTAMTNELDALKSNDVWTVVMPPKGAHVLQNKWFYKIKRYKRRHRAVQGSFGRLRK